MAAIPKPKSQVPALIYAAREALAEEWDGLGFSPSSLGSQCDRELWLNLHWAPAREVKSGRMLRLLETGNIQEERMVADLRAAGIEIYDVDPASGRQFTARALAGHLRGKLDGIITAGIPEAPATTHVFEAKTHGLASWKKLMKAGNLKAGKFEHWVQCQVYMHVRGIERTLYMAVCKDTDELYCERLEYDHEFCTRLMARLQRILEMDAPPLPVSENDKSQDCIFCRAKEVCRGRAFARLNCRTCLHASPSMDGEAAWSCARWSKPLGWDEQKAGCPSHLYVPDIVPGVMGEVDEERETIAYILKDGREWVDGQDRAEEPADVINEGE